MDAASAIHIRLGLKEISFLALHEVALLYPHDVAIIQNKTLVCLIDTVSWTVLTEI